MKLIKNLKEINNTRIQSILDNLSGYFIFDQTMPIRDTDIPWYAIRSYGLDAVQENKVEVSKFANKYGVDPDLFKAIIYTENAHGWYDFHMGQTVRPSNITPEIWGRILNHIQPSELITHVSANLESAAKLISAIDKRLPNANIASIATLYNNIKEKEISQYGQYVHYYYNKKYWNDISQQLQKTSLKYPINIDGPEKELMVNEDIGNKPRRLVLSGAEVYPSSPPKRLDLAPKVTDLPKFPPLDKKLPDRYLIPDTRGAPDRYVPLEGGQEDWLQRPERYRIETPYRSRERSGVRPVRQGAPFTGYEPGTYPLAPPGSRGGLFEKRVRLGPESWAARNRRSAPIANFIFN